MRRGAARRQRLERIFDDLGQRGRRIGHLVDKRRVRAVLEQPAHEVRQQILVAADRAIDTAGVARRQQIRRDAVQRLAHAVQALKFEGALRACHVMHRRKRMGVVGGELRIDQIAGSQQPPSGGDIRQVGPALACEDRIAGEAAFLRPLDLGIPISALDQPHHQAPVAPPGQRHEPVDQRQSALLIRLDREAEAIPVRQRRL